MIPGIGITDLFVILIVVLVLFVPRKLPELGRAFGQTLMELKNAGMELTGNKSEEKEKHGKVETRK
jgi:sec-independent protein translocase protein TatA